MYIVKWNEEGYLGPNFYVNDGEIRRIEQDIDWWMPAPPVPPNSDDIFDKGSRGDAILL